MTGKAYILLFILLKDNNLLKNNYYFLIIFYWQLMIVFRACTLSTFTNPQNKIPASLVNRTKFISLSSKSFSIFQLDFFSASANWETFHKEEQTKMFRHFYAI